MTLHGDRGSSESKPLNPVARIEAQDLEFTPPVREYLERYGCEVLVNKESSHSPDYLICIGDAEFVKTFFEHKANVGSRKLGIVYEGGMHDLISLRGKHIKFYFVDPVSLTEERTRNIFAFYFTGTEEFKDDRKEPRPQKTPNVTRKEATRELPVTPVEDTEDKKRITQVMQQIFRPKDNGELRNRRRSRWFLGVMISLVAILLPIALYFISLLTAAVLLYAGGRSLIGESRTWTNTLTSYGQSYLHSSRTLLRITSPAIILAGGEGLVEDQERLLSVLYDVAHIETGLLQIFETSRLVAGTILFPQNAKEQRGVADVIKLTTEVRNVAQHLGLVDAQLRSLSTNGTFPFTTEFVSNALEKGLSKVSDARQIVRDTERLLTIYPRMGGFRKKQTYLVLLQNSMELRPTGGFIGSLLLVTFVDGKVSAMEVQDVYTADGQLKGHIDPPLPIREILGSEHWYLRDSNWDPDFSESGRQAAWFYEKELGIAPDGVIAVSLPMVTRLLEVTGPVELLDFNERVSAGNFYAKSLLYTETDFFPGSTQKKDFLGALATALLTRITTDEGIPEGELLRTLTSAIQSKDLQFYFPETELQKLTDQWDWTGRVSIDQCLPIISEGVCVGDGMGLVEANLGVNKVNIFVSREALATITIGADGSIDHEMTLNVKNGAEDQGDGKNPYLLYLRALVPALAQISQVSLDGQPVAVRDMSAAVPPPAPYYYVQAKEDYSEVNIPFSISPHASHQVIVRWSIPKPSGSDDPVVMYQFNLRKQPGIASMPWQVIINYPSDWGIVNEGSLAKPGVFTYNTDLTKDESIRLIFQKRL